MKIIPIEEAVGKKLSHDLTGIIPGQPEHITYPRDYIVKQEDIEILKNMGKYHVNVIDENSTLIHENQAAIELAQKATGKGIELRGPKEGKVHAYATKTGLLITSRKKLEELNLIDGIKISTKRKHTVIEKGNKAATMLITPLEIEKEILNKALVMLDEPLIEIKPLQKLKIGIITTGNEVYEGRIKDAFLPYLKNKLEPYGYNALEQTIVRDNQTDIGNAIDNYINKGFELIFLTGGLSVDADDYTMKTVREHKDIEITAYGSPVLPGAMFLAAYYDNEIPLIGLPAGLLRGGNSILDLVLPVVLAKVKLTKAYIASLGDGGLL